MDVLYSKKKAKDKPWIYHKYGCIYQKRIANKNLRVIQLSKIMHDSRYCECKWCGGIHGEARVNKKAIARWEKKYGIRFMMNDRKDTLYIRTKVGFWKIFEKEDVRKYLLYHRNKFSDSMSDAEAMQGGYHRQSDVEETYSLMKIVEYITAHDRAKEIIADDYRKLPHSTKREKKYYKSAEKKVKRKKRRAEYKRLEDIFRALEAENSDFKRLSIN